MLRHVALEQAHGALSALHEEKQASQSEVHEKQMLEVF